MTLERQSQPKELNIESSSVAVSKQSKNILAPAPGFPVLPNMFYRVRTWGIVGNGVSTGLLILQNLTRIFIGDQWQYIPGLTPSFPHNDDGQGADSYFFPATEGELISMNVRCADTLTRQYGDVYVLVEIGFGRTSGTFQPVATLIGDYVTNLANVFYPAQKIVTAPEKQGSLQVLTGAGTVDHEFSLTVPTNQLWKVHGIILSFTAAAGGAARTPAIQISNATPTVFKRYWDTSTVAGGASAVLHVQENGFTAAANTAAALGAVTTALLNMFQILLREGYIISTLTENLAVGDQYTASVVEIERWVVPFD